MGSYATKTCLVSSLLFCVFTDIFDSHDGLCRKAELLVVKDLLTPPVLFQGIFLFSVIKYQPLTYEERPYPKWAEGLGWIIACASMLCVPITAVKVLCNAEGSSLEVC